MDAKRILDRLLRIVYILTLIAMPIVVYVTTSLYWTVADPSQSFNSPSLCVNFIYPFITTAALIVLIRKKLGSKFYSNDVNGLNRNPQILNAFWFAKLILWSASAIYMAYKMLTNPYTWDLNWQYGFASRLFFTPALVLHLVEVAYRYWPVIRTEMTSEHNLAIRILFTGKSLLFSGLAVRRTAVEKLIYTVRSLHWLRVMISVALSLPATLINAVFTPGYAMNPYEAICYYGGVITSHYLVMIVLRLIELIFFDKD